MDLTNIRFTKMHGLGNDYIYIECMSSVPERLSSLAVQMSDRHCGIGGDGIILILPSAIADFRMRIFNADGSEALMCGNGSRCVGKYVYDHRLTQKTNITLETNSGVKYLRLFVNPATDTVDSVSVDMGEPSLHCKDIGMAVDDDCFINRPASVNGIEYCLTAVSVGNPHGVIVVADVAETDVTETGSALEMSPIWTDRANIEFISINSPNDITMRVWERGSGETQACGTGACAAAYAAITNGLCSSPVTVHLPGGDLKIDLSADNHIIMTGPATEVFNGTYPLSTD